MTLLHYRQPLVYNKLAGVLRWCGGLATTFRTERIGSVYCARSQRVVIMETMGHAKKHRCLRGACRDLVPTVEARGKSCTVEPRSNGESVRVRIVCLYKDGSDYRDERRMVLAMRHT